LWLGTLQNVISEGAGGDAISQYKSIIYYHEDRPRWFETIKVTHTVSSKKFWFLFYMAFENLDKSWN